MEVNIFHFKNTYLQNIKLKILIFRIVLDSFRVNEQFFYSEENLFLIKNLKFMYFYEMSVNLNNPLSLDKVPDVNLSNFKAEFFNTFKCNNHYIIKFMKENIEMFKRIFFLENDHFKSCNLKDEQIMNIYIDTIINYPQSNTRKVKNIVHEEDFHQFAYYKSHFDNFDILNNKSFENRVQIKKEIIAILSFLIRTLKYSDKIDSEIIKFIIDLIDIFVLSKEEQEIIREISNLSKKIF